jgi:integrase
MTPKARESNPEGLPPCVYAKNGAYWLVKRGKWTRLGPRRPERLAADRRAALIAHARITTPTTGAMADLIDEAMVEILSRVKASSGKQYKTAARQLKEHLVEFEPQQVTTADVAAVKREYRGRPRAGNQALSVLRMVFVYAVENGYCDSNPCIGLPIFAVGKRDRLIEPGEYHAIRAQAPPMLQCFMDLLVTTGQRPRDVLRIRRADLTDDGITFRQQKTGAKLTVAWTPDMRDAVERLKALHSTAGLSLFRTKRGRVPSYQSIYEAWLTACEAAGVADAQLRDLRAVAGTEAQRQGINPQKLLGHTSAATTQRYLRGRETPLVESPFVRQVLDNRKNTREK